MVVAYTALLNKNHFPQKKEFQFFLNPDLYSSFPLFCVEGIHLVQQGASRQSFKSTVNQLLPQNTSFQHSFC